MITKNNFLNSFVMAIIVLSTIVVASATESVFVEFNDDPDLSIRTGYDSVATVYKNNFYYYDSDGLDKNISISPYHADNVTQIITDYSNNKDVYFICDAYNAIVCKVDYSAGSYSTIDFSSSFATAGITGDRIVLGAVFPDKYYFAYGTSAFNSFYFSVWSNLTYDKNNESVFICFEDQNTRCANPLYEPTSDGYYFYQGLNFYSLSPSFANLFLNQYFYNTTSSLISQKAWYYFESGTPWYSTSTTLYRCSLLSSEMVHCIGNTAGSGLLADFQGKTGGDAYDQTGAIMPYPTSPYNSQVIDNRWFDNNGAGQSIVLNGTSRVPMYFSSSSYLNPEDSLTAYDITKTFALSDGYMIQINSTHHLITNEYNTTSNYTNSPPYISSYTISDENPDLLQEIYIDIFEGGAELEDVIRYGVKCEGTGNYSENTNGQFACVYNNSGLVNLTIAVTDNFHVGSWYDEQNITINVSDDSFTSGILTIDVIDGEQLAVSGATVVVENQIKTTNDYGRVSFTTSEVAYYDAIISKNGYTTRTFNYLANGEAQIAQIISLTGETSLIVTVLDEEGLPIQDAIVSYTNTVSYDYNYDFSDGNGNAIFSNIGGGATIIQASANEYDSDSLSINVEEDLINYQTITLNLINPVFVGTSTDRGCVDNGIWLCGSMPVVEHSCTVDSDCELSNYCIKGLNTCSRFNYSKCDEIGMPRSQQCVVKLSAENTLNNTTNWVLTNLVWVVIMLILLVAFGMLFVAWKK